MDAFGKGCIYDQYDFIVDGRRKLKLDSIPIIVTSPQKKVLRASSERNIQEFSKRRILWKYSFEGDLLHLNESNPENDYIKRVFEIELSAKVSIFKKISNTISLVFNNFIYYYKQLFKYFMEKTCR